MGSPVAAGSVVVAAGLIALGQGGFPKLAGPAAALLTPALAIFAPTSTTNVDIAIDVTDFIEDLVLEGTLRTGFFVCGVFSEAGYNDLVYFGGADHTYPPRLVITTTGPVSDERSSWGGLKSLYR